MTATEKLAARPRTPGQKRRATIRRQKMAAEAAEAAATPRTTGDYARQLMAMAMAAARAAVDAL